EDRMRQFFNDCYDYVKQKCGEPYVMSAVVHMDEKTPHMHVAYIPVVDGVDRKKNPCKRVNCSEFWKGFNSYGILQDEFFAHITSRGWKLDRGEVGSRAEHLSVAELKRQTLDREIADLSKKLESAKKRFATMEGKAKGMEGVVVSKKKLDALQPEPGMLGTIKGLTLEDVQSLKKTAMEYYLLTEKVKELSVKYVNLKSKVPSEAEKLETAKRLAGIRQLEQETARLQDVLQSYGIDPNGRGMGREKDAR
ncbi:MAG: plasmid recombination protein, partial [Oscillospiraceae bacterium]|nr:plasmid recombination protein [Oscillospiraceae bacterium]